VTLTVVNPGERDGVLVGIAYAFLSFLAGLTSLPYLRGYSP
jgi:hypothetical protein